MAAAAGSHFRCLLLSLLKYRFPVLHPGIRTSGWGVCLLFLGAETSLMRFWRTGRVTDASFLGENPMRHGLDRDRLLVNKQFRSRVLCMCCVCVMCSKHRWQTPQITGFLYHLSGMGRVICPHLCKITITALTSTTGTGRLARENEGGTLHSRGAFQTIGKDGITVLQWASMSGVFTYSLQCAL